MTEARTMFHKAGNTAHIRFNNPAAYNALTSQMWQELRDFARSIADDPAIRVVTFRGVGGKAFVSGTDIAGFTKFVSGADGIEYEHRIDECMSAIDEIPVATVAIIDGWAVGGGLNIASACDFRIATADARFGSPIGRTLGNCLSPLSLARIGNAVGISVARRMVLLGEIVGAKELHESGFLIDAVEREALDSKVEALCVRAAENAPLTTRAFKEVLRRLSLENLPQADDIIEQIYRSDDFKSGVKSFVERKKAIPQWQGR